MPHSLAWKLSIAFILVALLASVLVGVSLHLVNPAQFNSLVITQQRAEFRAMVVDYYQANDSWKGVSAYIQQQFAATAEAVAAQSTAVPQIGGPGGDPVPGGGPVQRDLRTQFGLADAQGTVVFSMMPELTIGAPAPANWLAQGEKIALNGNTVGISLTAPRPPNLSPEESAYLQRINLALALASTGAFLVALLMGVLLARTLTQPLHALTQAAHRMAEGHLEQEVDQRSRDEIGQLAAAFNQMSRAVAQANTARRQMAVDVAHELRTPLTVISGYIESMRDGVLAPSPKRLAVISTEIEQLQHLVEDLRILSQADAGELKVTRRPMDPAAFLRNACATFEEQALKKGITLEADIPENIPPITVDETRMAQVVANLVSNALRHTPSKGKIVLGARDMPEGVLFTVRDSGSGINPEDLPHIFDRFYRADESGSTGLGLAIARALVAAHGGTLEAESTQGIGTTMRILLPRVDD